MFGWNGCFLRVDLNRNKAVADSYGQNFAFNFLGGRGFAAKILWDQLKPGVDPLSPDNKLILAAGPLTGFGFPNSGKLVVAAKSPLTMGYGDGNLGTNAAVQMRKAGYDAVIIEGKAQKPIILHVKDETAEFIDAGDFWGLDSFETEQRLKEHYEQTAGIVTIGPAGENLVRFATVVSEEGRSGGRPGMGAVMGSKNLKAIVFEGHALLQAARPRDLQEVGPSGSREVITKPGYEFWKRQGTMCTIEWSQEHSALPTFNYREGVFDDAENIGGYAMEKRKVANGGCPQCNMTCGNVIKGSDRKPSQLDYENVAMLGSNIGLGNLSQVAALNRLADGFGMDAISLGNVLGFAMEASEEKLIKEEVPWGKFKETEALVKDIAYRRGLGGLLADGVRYAAAKVGGGSSDWAMHVKGLEVTGYDCHAAPAMALAYATSSIGAHHKDAWVITWDIKLGRGGYTEEKVDNVIEMQRLCGGIFESLVLCRFPHTELGLELEWYPRFLNAATGMELSWATLNQIADRTLNLIRSFWVREFAENWNREMDMPPKRWFKEPLTKGPIRGSRLDQEKFDAMLNKYYKKRGWDDRGVPRKNTLKKLGLADVASQLGRRVSMSD